MVIRHCRLSLVACRLSHAETIMADERPHGRGDGGSPMRGRRELLSELEAAFVQPSGADVRSAAPPRPSPPPQVHARSSAGRSGARSLHLTHPKLSLPSVPASHILSARCFALCRLPRLGRSHSPLPPPCSRRFFVGARAPSTAILLLGLLGRRPCAEWSCVLPPIPSVARAPPETEQLRDWHWLLGAVNRLLCSGVRLI